MEEAGRSAKPPLMMASAAGDLEPEAVPESSAARAQGTKVNPVIVESAPEDVAPGGAPSGETAPALDDASSGEVAGSRDASEGAAHAAEAHTAAGSWDGGGAAEDDADGSFAWNSSAWDSSPWDSPADASSTAVAPSSDSSSSSSFSGGSDLDSTLADGAFTSPFAPSRGSVPFPADEVGNGRPAAESTPESTAPSDSSAATSSEDGRAETSPVDRFGAAATAFNSKLGLNDKLDRGRQVWRQALTGPNNWFSGLTSSRTSSAPAETRSPYDTPSRESDPAGTGYSGAEYAGSGFGSAGGPGGMSSTAGNSGGSGYRGAGYADSVSSGASYGGPAATGAASGGDSRGRSGAGGAAPGSAAYAAGAAGAAYAGTRAGTGSASAWRPKAAVSKGKRKGSPRRQAQLTLSRVEPWSVMKFSFVVSVVAFIVLFVAVALLYMVLSSLGVFDSLQHTVTNLTSGKNQAGTNVSSWWSASRVLGYTGMLGAFNIVLITAMSTIGAVVYNLIAHTIGGIEVTLRETE